MADRNTNSPSAIYGIRPGFNIADLVIPYGTSIQAITNATTTTTSAAIDKGFRSISMTAQFTNQNTSCDIIVQDTSESPVTIATFLDVNWTCGDILNVGGYENLSLNGAPFTVTVQNIQNASAISVFVKKTS